MCIYICADVSDGSVMYENADFELVKSKCEELSEKYDDRAFELSWYEWSE